MIDFLEDNFIIQRELAAEIVLDSVGKGKESVFKYDDGIRKTLHRTWKNHSLSIIIQKKCRNLRVQSADADLASDGSSHAEFTRL